jgi:hypothetical protein
MRRRTDNSSSDCRNWTTAKLLSEIRKYANLESFGSYFRDDPVSFGHQQESGDWIREETRRYRETWLNPMIDELEARLTRR